MRSSLCRFALLFAAGLLLSGPALRAETPAPAAPKRSFAGPKVGEPVPELRAIGPDGQECRLADFRGKTVLLDFWATWCGPCQAAMPHNNALAVKHAADGLVVLAVCVYDTRENYAKWLHQAGAGYTFHTAHDPAGKDRAASAITGPWAVSMLPAIFVIDRDGRLVGRAGGGGPKENPAVIRLLAKAGIPVDVSHLPPEKK